MTSKAVKKMIKKSARCQATGKNTAGRPVVIAEKRIILTYAKKQQWIPHLAFIFFIITFFVSLISSIVSATSTPLNASIVTYYKMDNSTYDSVGGLHNLTNYNGTTITGQFINMSLLTTRWANTTISLSAISSSNTFSLSFWLKRTGTISNFPSFYGNEIGSVDANGETKAFSNGDDLDIYAQDSGGLKTLNGNAMGLNTWNFYVITYDGSSLNIYQNNTQTVTQLLSSFNLLTNPLLFFGSNMINNMSNVVFDEIGFWNKSLNTSDINQLWNNGTGLTYPFIVPPEAVNVTTNQTAGILNVDLGNVATQLIFLFLTVFIILLFIFGKKLIAGALIFFVGIAFLINGYNFIGSLLCMVVGIVIIVWGDN